MHERWSRVIVIVLDGVGVGALPDAAAYGDAGSDTLGNLALRVRVRVPELRRLGLDRVAALGGARPVSDPAGAFGRMAEVSPGKDSVTGHWELMGVHLDRPFPVFPRGFPREVIREFEHRIGRTTLGNRPASGTQIIEDLGAEHLRTRAPIVYTSADSVFQLAAHEAIVSVDELYRFCETAYTTLCEGLGVGRVIARPFTGTPGHFTRTANRRDFARPAPVPTLLDRLSAAGLPVVAIGKVDDLFAGRGITEAIRTKSDAEGMDALEAIAACDTGGLVVANLVDFDSVYGHRNDPEGYVENLERFDDRLAALLPRLGPGDLLLITSDHGNDPTTPSTAHSREYVPLLAAGSGVRAGTDLGVRSTFADVGQTVAEVFGVERFDTGSSFLPDLGRAVARRHSEVPER